MQTKTVISLGAAAVLGLGAVLAARVYMSAGRVDAPVVKDTGSTPVVVAAQPLARGFKLQSTVLKVAHYPTDAVPAGAFRSIPEAASGPGGARIALKDIAANEPILADRVSGSGGRSNLASSLGEGMRAVSLRANDVAGVGGFVLPGDRVDVLLTRSKDNNQPETSLTQVLAENVRVVGVDQSDDQGADKPVVVKAITVEVTPDQAQAITLAQAVGAVSLALRQISDQAPLGRRTMTLADLSRGMGPTQVNAPALTPVRAVAPRRPAAPRSASSSMAPPSTEVRVTRGVETTGYRVGL
ncbi:Flp pilus assembly protein CpaB [Caulobacter endophyticus]|uniref:Flp pilus assembly protein CpaB n=1 Tax=Caulobacter endophyticus TaxID=2172652 RepID=A0A2T9JH59_9CAUL|nr:Flp pilus assembly protein CpaB [Caulobacter endophyticus]PVM83018.1 Flp pilus assembly protein CpaB [Caulobacter endophyticus]